jgi:tRNA-dihydrouridine synthase 2
MGSELLKDKQQVKEILTTLVQNIDKPITCKIRIFPDEKETIELVQMIEKTGVAAIGVHARYIPDRPRDPARLERLSDIVNSGKFKII